MLYSKTGVTGPYILGGGFITYLLSKEIYVIEHEFYTGATLALMFVYAVKKFGASTAESLDQQIAEAKARLRAGRDDTIVGLNNNIAAEELNIDQAKGQTVLFLAKKENISLQLEAAYRERLQRVHSEVKKRLDYQLETSNVTAQFHQRHMVDWIVESVRKSITPAQEAASLKQCIADLKGLAAAKA
uniref:ATP synthase subunit b n=1 Tax=Hirondellea gigas TaxID=1518452 RepID=A0A2P2HW07_9CRUS